MKGRQRLLATALVIECLALALFAAISRPDSLLLDYLVRETRAYVLLSTFAILIILLITVNLILFGRSSLRIRAVVWLVIAACVGWSGALSLRVLDHPWPGRAKQSLHAIQLALERYADDNDGRYPEFLIGGESTSSRVMDSLQKGEYLPIYPDNLAVMRRLCEMDRLYRFIRGVFPSLIQSPYYRSRGEDVAALQEIHDDPYHAGHSVKRFGASYGSMGNVAADHRFNDAKWGYPFWNREPGSRDTLTVALQGQFYYKALYKSGSDRPDGYVLMLFADYGNEGQDVLTTVPGGHELDCRLPDGTGVGMGVPVITQLGLEPDGKPDGVIIVLTGGWLWEE